MPYEPVNVIEVWCWGHLVGAAAWDPNARGFAFEFDPGWVSRGVDLAPLRMSTASRRATWIFPDLAVRTYYGLPAMLADALPDAFGNAIVDAYLAGQGIDPAAVTALDRLAYLGQRAMGALEFRPGRGPHPMMPTAVVLDDLVTTARAALNGDLRADATTKDVLADLLAVGTSAGGARAKAVVALDADRTRLRSGQVEVEEGWEHWLLKLDIGDTRALADTGPYCRIEFAYSLMARAAGITMADCHLLEENGRAHFMTRRFDRIGNERIHLQSLCALDHLDFNQIGVHAYDQYFQAIIRLGLGDEARREAFRRMAFNVAAGNFDDHTKNLAFLLPEHGTWGLAPAYDLTHAHDENSRWLRQHLMVVNGKDRDITRADLLEVARRHRVLDAPDLLTEILAAVTAWPDYAATASVPVPAIDTITTDIATLTDPLH